MNEGHHKHKTFRRLKVNMYNSRIHHHHRRSSFSSSSSSSSSSRDSADGDVDLLSGLRVFFRSLSSNSAARQAAQEKSKRRIAVSLQEQKSAAPADVTDSPTKVRYRTSLSADDAVMRRKVSRCST